MEEDMPPGFRFHPTDEELITYYLTPKVSDFGFTSKAIADVDLNKCEPWDLPAKASMGEKEWYFFSLRDRKYPTGLRTNRATEAGYWKTTGKDKKIFRQPGGMLVGMKKTLVFYKGRAPKGKKTNWVMHEYRTETTHPFRPAKEEWVVCRVFQKTIIINKPQQSSSPLGTSMDISLDDNDDENTNNNEFGDIELSNLNSLSSPSSSSLIANPSFQGFHNIGHHNPGIVYDNTNTNNDNWLEGGGGGGVAISSLPTSNCWSSSLLSPSLNTTVNSLLLKALQLRSYHAREGPTTDIFSFLPQLSRPPPFGSTSQDPTIPISSPTGVGVRIVNNNNNNIINLACTSSQQQQPQQQQNLCQQQQPQDQPFNIDSLW